MRVRMNRKEALAYILENYEVKLSLRRLQDLCKLGKIGCFKEDGRWIILVPFQIDIKLHEKWLRKLYVKKSSSRKES